MPHYRLYRLERDGHIRTPPLVVECGDDGAAVAEARKLLNDGDVEVWEGARLVARLGRSGEAG